MIMLITHVSTLLTWDINSAIRFSLLEGIQLTGYITKVQWMGVDLWNLWIGYVQEFSIRALISCFRD